MKLLLSIVAALGLIINAASAQHNKISEKTKTDATQSFARLYAASSSIHEEDAAQTVEPSLPTYLPQAVSLPKNARYVLRDGSISIIGYNDMDGIMANLNALFVRTHPGFKFKMLLKGTATGAPALTHGVSAFTPMGAEFSALELASYKQIVGYEPFAFRVAHCSLNPLAKSAPVGIYVNKSNPLAKLTVNQLAQIFSTGNLAGDITHWGQLGIEGEWAKRAIHPYGIAEEAAAGLATFMLKKMDRHPFTPSYDAFMQSGDVVKIVAEDQAGIGFASGNFRNPQVKIIAIAENEGGYYSALSTEDVVAGKYPLDRYLLIYVRRLPHEPLDPFVKEYLRMILSRDGQQAIADAAPKYLPLNAREVAEELAKLN
jgi:phosphate transport system substrate-binding protein